MDDIAILVTDGYSNVNRGNTIPEAERAKDQGIGNVCTAAVHNSERERNEGIGNLKKE